MLQCLKSRPHSNRIHNQIQHPYHSHQQQQCSHRHLHHRQQMMRLNCKWSNWCLNEVIWIWNGVRNVWLKQIGTLIELHSFSPNYTTSKRYQPKHLRNNNKKKVNQNLIRIIWNLNVKIFFFLLISVPYLQKNWNLIRKKIKMNGTELCGVFFPNVQK